jgi:predicted dehydrogenase
MSEKVPSPVRVAIIGCGGIAQAHVRGINKYSDKIKCVALCDVSEDNLKRLDEQLGGVDAHYGDWKKMLAEMDADIDATIMCLPHDLHAQAILDCVAAGKHILCEKPMCINLEEGDRIVEKVKASGITYMSAHNQLFMESVQKARQLLQDNAIGKIRWIRSQDCFRAGGDSGDGFVGAWRADAKRQGGGELIDTGYHPSYRLLYLADSEVVGIRGTMGRFQQKIQGEDTASVQVRFANGIIGEIFTSWAMALPYGVYQIHIVGDDGEIFGSQNDLFILRKGETEPEKIELRDIETFEEQVSHFADCLIEGKRPIHGAEEGRAVLEVILKATQDADGWQQYAPVQVD